MNMQALIQYSALLWDISCTDIMTVGWSSVVNQILYNLKWNDQHLDKMAGNWRDGQNG